MPKSYRYPVYPYRRSADQDASSPAHHPVIVVGAGPVGLSMAVDLGLRGIATLLLDEDDTVSDGSRGICFAKRTLEIFDRLGVGDRIVEKGVTWNKGKVYSGDRLIYAFDLLPESGHKRPAFVNIQQYYIEDYLIERAGEIDGLDVRWKNRVIGVEPDADGVTVTVETPEGDYTLKCDYLIAADGAKSGVRDFLGLPFEGRSFEEQFLITDIVMSADFPAERRFWFNPAFHDGQSALLHRQPDDVWRIDLQLDADADREAEGSPERTIPRLKAILGEDQPFEVDWTSVYRFRCARLEHFREGRVFFVGDAAHIVSPFGARGGNAGIQDADNLAWKIAAVLERKAPEALLASYEAERIPAADENIRYSARSTDFMTPKSRVNRIFRDAVLDLAERFAFARRMVNSGRLSTPSVYSDSPLNSPDAEDFLSGIPPGAAAADAPLKHGRWLIDHLGGGFAGLWFASDPGEIDAARASALERLAAGGLPIRVFVVAPEGAEGAVHDLPVLVDRGGLAFERYDASGGAFYLFRPDQHVAARFRRLEIEPVNGALARALGRDKSRSDTDARTAHG